MEGWLSGSDLVSPLNVLAAWQRESVERNFVREGLSFDKSRWRLVQKPWANCRFDQIRK